MNSTYEGLNKVKAEILCYGSKKKNIIAPLDRFAIRDCEPFKQLARSAFQ
jgi:hypothetical protein